MTDGRAEDFCNIPDAFLKKRGDYNFLISQPKHVADTQKKSQREGSFEHPKFILKLLGKKIFTILRLKILF